MSEDSERRLEAALRERDEALLALATERERSNALRLRLERLGEPEPPRYPTHAGIGPTPLRYVVVDRLNESIKGVLGPLHGPLKRAVARFGGPRR